MNRDASLLLMAVGITVMLGRHAGVHYTADYRFFQ